MAYFKFEEDDLFLNTVQAYPQVKFYIQSGTVYINNFPNVAGNYTDNFLGVPKGFISLYEYNINRPSDNSQNIRPLVFKDGTKTIFKTTSTASYNALPFSAPGNPTLITSSYNMSVLTNN